MSLNQFGLRNMKSSLGKCQSIQTQPPNNNCVSAKIEPILRPGGQIRPPQAPCDLHRPPRVLPQRPRHVFTLPNLTTTDTICLPGDAFANEDAYRKRETVAKSVPTITTPRNTPGSTPLLRSQDEGFRIAERGLKTALGRGNGVYFEVSQLNVWPIEIHCGRPLSRDILS